MDSVAILGSSITAPVTCEIFPFVVNTNGVSTRCSPFGAAAASFINARCHH